MLTPLPKEFYTRDAISVAKDLLGKYLVRTLDNIQIIGKIVETESYLPFIDEAAHSFIGKTARTSILFGNAGYSYVYSIHQSYCLNIVCDIINVPGCVLIRALEPIKSMDQMQKFRGIEDFKNLTNGPGKLCKALQINKELNGIDVTQNDSPLIITTGDIINSDEIITTTRIGISKAKEMPLRFYIKGNHFISK